MYRSPYLVVLAGAAVALAACSNDTSPNNGANVANVRIVNASSTNATVNAANGSNSLASNLAFQNAGAATTCATIPAGNQTLSFTTAGGTSLASTTSNFAAGQNYTAVVYDNASGTGSNAIIFPDAFTTPTSGNMGIRFINATGAAGDIYATTPGGTVSGSPTVSNMSALSGTFAPTWMSIPSGNTSFSMYAAGANTSTATPISTFTLGSMPTNRVSTVIFTRATASGAPTAFSVSTCS